MEASRTTTKYWMLFALWVIIFIILFVFVRQFFWMALPGVVTYFSKAMNLL